MRLLPKIATDAPPTGHLIGIWRRDSKRFVFGKTQCRDNEHGSHVLVIVINRAPVGRLERFPGNKLGVGHGAVDLRRSGLVHRPRSISRMITSFRM
jgi:hypothetical protein